nr:MAG TPA: hypothetical protein [Siphoviridae sp. ctngg6]
MLLEYNTFNFLIPTFLTNRTSDSFIMLIRTSGIRLGKFRILRFILEIHISYREIIRIRNNPILIPSREDDVQVLRKLFIFRKPFIHDEILFRKCHELNLRISQGNFDHAFKEIIIRNIPCIKESAKAQARMFQFEVNLSPEVFRVIVVDAKIPKIRCLNCGNCLASLHAVATILFARSVLATTASRNCNVKNPHTSLRVLVCDMDFVGSHGKVLDIILTRQGEFLFLGNLTAFLGHNIYNSLK